MPSSTIDDLAVKPEALFKAPFKTIKLAPVTKMKIREKKP